MDFDDIMIFIVFFFLCLLICTIIVSIGLFAGFIASWLGLTGIMWWAVTIVFYLLIAGIIMMINRIGRD